MADISIEFHALNAELLAFVQQAVSEFHLHVVALEYRPFSATELNGSQIPSWFDVNSRWKRMQFTLDPPVLTVLHELDFADKNPDSLRLDIGSQDEQGLKESWLSASTGNAEAIAVWKQIAKRLRNMTIPGATAINPKTGDVGPAKEHRFTNGAKQLALNGVPMLTITGIILKPS